MDMNEGMIPTEDDDTTEDGGDGTDDSAASPASNMLAEALNYGRQRHGLPAKFFDQQIDRAGMANPGRSNDPNALNKAVNEEGNQDDITGDYRALMLNRGAQDLQPGEEIGWEGNLQGYKPKTARLAEGGPVPGSGEDGGDSDDETGPGLIPSRNNQVSGSDHLASDTDRGQHQGPDPQKLVGYLKGADAMPSEMVMALEQQVDPQGQMDPNQRRQIAMERAGSPDKAWGLLQHYRQKFNAYNAFAQAAAQGGGQKPPDLMASAKAATRAYEHLPDGKRVSFMPMQGGVRVHVDDANGNGVPDQQEQSQDPGQGQPQQSFEEGGAVEEVEGDPETTGAIPASQGSPPGDDPNAGVPTRRKAPHEYLRDFALSTAQYLGFLKEAGQADAVLDKGVEKTLEEASKKQVPDAFMPGAQGAYTRPSQGTGPQIGNAQQPQPQFPGQQGGVPGAPKPTPVNVPQPENYTLKDVLHEIDQQFPSVGMSQQRAEARHSAIQTWMANRAKIEAEQTKGETGYKRATEVARIQGGSRQNVADTNNAGRIQAVGMQQQGGNERAAQKFQTVRDVESQKEAGREDRFSRGEVGKMDRTIVTNKPGVIGSADKMDAARKSMGGSPAPASPQQGAAPQGGAQLPPAAMQSLSEGKVTTFKNGQRWTLQGGRPLQVQ